MEHSGNSCTINPWLAVGIASTPVATKQATPVRRRHSVSHNRPMLWPILGTAHRHKEHVKDLIRERSESERTEHGSQLLERVEKLTDTTEKILASATSKEDLRAATGAVTALTRLLELLGRLSGELQSSNTPGIRLSLQKTTINVSNYDSDPEWATMLYEADARL